MSWTEAGVIVAVIGAAFATVRELYTTFWVNRKKDKAALDVAKAQQPEIMRQLELGNFKAAAEGISIAQTFVSEQLKYAQEELKRLRDRETALEAEASGWEKTARELQSKVANLEGRLEVMDTLIRECQGKLQRK